MSKFQSKFTRAVLTAALLAAPLLAQTPARPKITGIDHIAFYTTAPAQTEHLMATVFGLASAPTIEPNQTLRYMVGSQWIGYSPAPDAASNNRMDHIAFRTTDVAALRSYLRSKSVQVPEIVKHPDGSLSFMVNDPEGNPVEFVELAKSAHKSDEKAVKPADPVSRHIIHTGYLVRDSIIEDSFYRDILGFRSYWHGGWKSGITDWNAIQVPDGTDWMEYMLNSPEHPDRRSVGVMNHLSLGVADIHNAQAKLESHGWKPNDAEKSQMGLDGKWQLNLFDADLSRFELMEFRPVQKPCCSEFMGEHPKE